MLEITLLHAKADGGAATMTAFQFENDALQSFLTEAQANETGVAFASIRALGVPLTVTADMPARKAKAADAAKADATKPVKPSTERK